VPVLVPNNSPGFASLCIDLHSGVQNLAGKTQGRQRKETPRELGVSEMIAAFLAAIESGETGIRTLGTLAGTPVFKTGFDLTQPPTQTSVMQKDDIRGARIGAELSGGRFLGRHHPPIANEVQMFPVKPRFPFLENM
jgi:hypothetical protein